MRLVYGSAVLLDQKPDVVAKYDTSVQFSKSIYFWRKHCSVMLPRSHLQLSAFSGGERDFVFVRVFNPIKLQTRWSALQLYVKTLINSKCSNLQQTCHAEKINSTYLPTCWKQMIPTWLFVKLSDCSLFKITFIHFKSAKLFWVWTQGTSRPAV